MVRLALDRAQTQIVLPWEPSPGEPVVLIGVLPDGRLVCVPLSALRQHWLWLGPTGGGKTAADAHRAVQMLIARIGTAVAWASAKPDLCAYTRAGLAHFLMKLRPREIEAWLERIVILAPGGGNLVPLQILAPSEGADPELLAFDTTSSFGDLADSSIGVRQEDILTDLIALLIELGLPITIGTRLLQDPTAVAKLARKTRTPERFLSFAEKLRREGRGDRLAGLASRLNRITRLRSIRLMLAADTCVDFGSLLSKQKIVLIDLGVPTHGSEAATQFLGRFLWTRFTRTALSRPIGSPYVSVHLDEFQELVGAGPDAATELERCLRLTRARNVFFSLATQTLAGLAKVSSTLPEILSVNIGVRVAFRGADIWDAALPVSGRAARPRGAPWEERRGSYFLSRSEELAQLHADVETLPNRACFVHDASTGKPAFRMSTADAHLEYPRDCPKEIIDGLERGSVSLSESELERSVERHERRFADFCGGSAAPPTQADPIHLSSVPADGESAPPTALPLRRHRSATFGIG